MVYECPQCKTPLPPGASSCARCGLQFATPIPGDATLPTPGSAPPLDDTTSYDGMPGTEGGPSRRVVAIVSALCAVLVIIAAFAVYTFSRTPVASPSGTVQSGAPAAQSAPLPRNGAGTSASTGAPYNAGAGNLAPVTLPSGGAGSGAAAQNNGGALVGRWQAKGGEFYAFNADGTGSRGSAGSPKSESFTWAVDENEIILNAKSSEHLTFSSTNSTTLFLRLPNGRYVQFTRSGTA